MLRPLIFDAMMVGCCGYALFRGSPPERIAAVLYVAAVEASHFALAPMALRYRGIEWGVFSADLALFVGLYILSALSARFWPIWMAAIQGVVLLSHAMVLAPALIPWTYGNAVTLWSYPMLALLAVATWRHRRRLRLYGADPAWPRDLPAAYRAGGSVDEIRSTDH